MSFSPQLFDCQMYVSPRGNLGLSMAHESGPRKVITLQPIEYDDLVDVSFRRLLAAFNAAPQPLSVA